MSEFHEFYDISCIGPTILWDVWGSSDPVTVEELLDYNFSDWEIRRELMYYISSELLLPIRSEEGLLSVKFNPAIEWMIAVGELVRQHSKAELQEKLREADAEKRVHTDLYEYDSSEEYYSSEDNADVSEMVHWMTAEITADWVADAIEYYDFINTLFTTDPEQYVSKEDVEKQFVEQTDFSKISES